MSVFDSVVKKCTGPMQTVQREKQRKGSVAKRNHDQNQQSRFLGCCMENVKFQNGNSNRMAAMRSLRSFDGKGKVNYSTIVFTKLADFVTQLSNGN